MIRFACISILAAVALTACATVRDEPTVNADGAEVCRQDTPETFILTGTTDAAMAACVRASFQPTTRTVIVDSMGGDVENALNIAEVFEGHSLTFRVRNECNSSCANYFLPLAGRIEIEPGAIVLLHGSIDEQFIDMFSRQERERFARSRDPRAWNPEESLRKFQALADRQNAFAQRNAIPPGWLFTRHPGSNRIDGITGGPGGPARSAVIVEERLMRSCLTQADIQPYQPDLNRRLNNPVRWLGMMIVGIVRSNTMECVGD